MSISIKESTAAYVFATWNDLLIAVWRGETTMAGVRLGHKCFDEHTKAHPRGILMLTIIAENAPAPGAAERTELGKLLKDGAGRVRRSAVVYEGEGFRAAAIRSVVTGLSLLSRPPFPHKIFSAVRDATAFLAEDRKHEANMVARLMSDAVQEARDWSAD